MEELRGNVGIGHCRYPTAGSSSCAEAQPLYTNYPYGICVAHNGNLTNTDSLAEHIIESNRHVNTDSDSELLLNLFAEALNKYTVGLNNASTSSNRGNCSSSDAMREAVFLAATDIMNQCKGGYASVYVINGVGLVALRDPHGIRPLVFGYRDNTAATKNGSSNSNNVVWNDEMMTTANNKLDYVVASESVAIDALGFQLARYG